MVKGCKTLVLTKFNPLKPANTDSIWISKSVTWSFRHVSSLKFPLTLWYTLHLQTTNILLLILVAEAMSTWWSLHNQTLCVSTSLRKWNEVYLIIITSHVSNAKSWTCQHYTKQTSSPGEVEKIKMKWPKHQDFLKRSCSCTYSSSIRHKTSRKLVSWFMIF